MKNALLISASGAALVAAIGLASAQGLNERRDAPAAATSEQKASEGQKGKEKSTLPQKIEKLKSAPTAQAPEAAKPAPTAQAPEKAKPVPTAQAPEMTKPLPSVQVQEKDKAKPAAQAPGKTTDDHQTVGQSPRTTDDHKAVGQSPSQGAAPDAAARKGSAQKGQDSFASAPMSAEQNVKFREALKGEKAERLSNVRFSILIGDVVPRSVHFYRLPARIVEYAPQYRDFDYILVGDDILVVDPRTHRIVAVISA